MADMRPGAQRLRPMTRRRQPADRYAQHTFPSTQAAEQQRPTNSRHSRGRPGCLKADVRCYGVNRLAVARRSSPATS
jgi:hypothetical protein